MKSRKLSPEVTLTSSAYPDSSSSLATREVGMRQSVLPGRSFSRCTQVPSAGVRPSCGTAGLTRSLSPRTDGGVPVCWELDGVAVPPRPRSSTPQPASSDADMHAIAASATPVRLAVASRWGRTRIPRC
ncbi:MAG TPA: hypothetical protein VFX33_14875 [Actinomycetales bacterium]|nr:hypothetical protein [Actinomycetales bacterium]